MENHFNAIKQQQQKIKQMHAVLFSIGESNLDIGSELSKSIHR